MKSIQNISNGDPGIDVAADTFNPTFNASVYYYVDGSPIGTATASNGAPAI